MTFFTFTAGALNGLFLGGLYAITALGLSMVFGVMRLVNVVHGELLVLGAYFSFFISTGLGIDPLLTTLIVAPILFLLGYSIQLWVLNPVMNRGMEPPLLTAFGLSIIAQSLFIYLWSGNSRTITTGYSEQGVALAGINVPLMYIIAFVLSIVLIAVVQIFITRTYPGKAIRAATQDPETAQVMGINVKSIYALTYAIGASSAALGGALIGLTFSFIPASGLTWLLKGFVVVVLGGMGSIVGTLAGGLILGVAEGMGAAIVGTGYRDMIGLIIFLVFLVIRPSGLFGRTRS
ncbi:MAG: branched-chain amino acid ABC transporter permease [Deltaproteobacteria bacterium]|nr:branched-chain amino acid ABC transporter permease [Deltaproteobacteria bacterium]MBW1861814.1 branched-chain amino acid ABC transporter permease [Deltaproteobacteria bacterium]